MLTKEDKSWITNKFATKADIKLLATKKELEVIGIDVEILKRDFSEMKKTNLRIEAKVDKVFNKLDKFVGNIATLEQENKMGAITLRRHDVQIHELATAAGATITRISVPIKSFCEFSIIRV